MKPIHIVGGGLAGLTLGIALRQAGVPVTVTESGNYPRHRVCGEFISGAGQQTLHALGIDSVLTDAATNRETAWFAGNRLLFSASLPSPAFGLSRFHLDRRLADRFRDLGGTLNTGRRVRKPSAEPGIVWAGGRQTSSPRWIALKLHCRGLKPTHDLTMHLGTGGYVGVSRIEDSKVNICGLFRTRRNLSPGKERILMSYLGENDLHDLAEQLAAAKVDPASIRATTALDFTSQRWPEDAVRIGDSNTAIPPFSGNGMSMAFESAHAALPHLLDYARHRRSWFEARETLRRDLRRQFRLRLATARLLHPLLLHPWGQKPVTRTLPGNLLPFQLLYRLLR